MPQKVSIIIPAYNEENHIQKTLKSLRRQSYQPMEIIVVENGSQDKTYEIAEQYADKVLNFINPIGAGRARNEGAKIAGGGIFIFLDADSQLSDTIEKIIQSVTLNTVGTCLGKPDSNNLKGKLFFLFKNYLHRLKIYKGVIDGVLFCHRDIFFKINGFNEKRHIAEFNDFIKRAIRAGGKYKLLTDCYATVSLRRYEKKGYLKTVFFWIKWKITSFFQKDNKIASKYFEKNNYQK